MKKSKKMNIKKQKQKIKDFFIGLFIIILFFGLPVLVGIITEIICKYPIEKYFYYICIFTIIILIVKFFKD